jgi:AcrR family transcriptional regulator
MPKIVNHNEYREELLRKSFLLFSRKGYSNVTIRELAKVLGISTGLLYHYFDSKDTLFEQMVQFLVREDVAQFGMMEQNTSSFSPEHVIEVLFQFIQSKESYFQSIVLMVGDVYRYNEDGHNLDVLKECLRIYREAIRQHLNLENSEFEKMLLSILIGTIFQRMIDPNEVSFEETSEFLQKTYPIMAV